MTRDSTHVVEITGDAGLRAAQDLAVTLRQAIATQDEVAIATDAITSADITTIQLLLAASKMAKASGKSLRLTAPPKGVLRELLTQTGFLDAEGRALTPDGDLWTPSPSQAKGKAA
ncbi:MAG: hypothetical protein JWQ22_1056 [Devosia sp.]|nr:hypothetical protein [Devosia sp.]